MLAGTDELLANVTDNDAERVRETFNIKTVTDLGNNKYFAAARAMLAPAL